MRRSKRVLAEADPNASTISRQPAKSVKTVEKSKTRQNDQGAPSSKRTKIANTAYDTSISDSGFIKYQKLNMVKDGEQIDYKSKDNSKLRMFLQERGMSTSGSREELIEKLENSSINYNNLPSSELTDLLKTRRLKMAHMGTREIKVERLRNNDKLCHNSTDGALIRLYVRVSLYEQFIPEHEEKKRQARLKSAYADYTIQRLKGHLSRRGLPTDGTTSELIARLQEDDVKIADASIKEFEAELKDAIHKLETSRGRPYEAGTADWEMSTRDEIMEDIRIQEKFAAVASIPKSKCNYAWKESKWAERTERELSDICQRREMPGHGPKWAMIKWLDTGVLDYEDEVTTSLASKCRKRGLRFKSTAKKDDLIKLLREADAADK